MAVGALIARGLQAVQGKRVVGRRGRFFFEQATEHTTLMKGQLDLGKMFRRL